MNYSQGGSHGLNLEKTWYYFLYTTIDISFSSSSIIFHNGPIGPQIAGSVSEHLQCASQSLPR